MAHTEDSSDKPCPILRNPHLITPITPSPSPRVSGNTLFGNFSPLYMADDVVLGYAG